MKSVAPLVLVDDQGNPLPVVTGEDVEVHQRAPHPIREGDIAAGARVMATGETTPDGLLNAHMITFMGEGGPRRERGALSGTIMSVSDQSVTLRPRFAPDDMRIRIDPAAKLSVQERLDLHSIQVGDTLSFSGKLVRGRAAPKTLVVRTITPAGQEAPPIEEAGRGPFGGFGGFGGQSETATVTGKIRSLDPVRVQTADGRTVEITVPGQVAYVRFRPLARGDLKAGQKALFTGRPGADGFIAERVVVNPWLATGPGF